MSGIMSTFIIIPLYKDQVQHVIDFGEYNIHTNTEKNYNIQIKGIHDAILF